MTLDDMLVKWNEATGNLSWGVQRVFRDALELVAKEQVTLVWGADYSANSPCLVNSVAAMLTTGGGHGVPSQNFGDVVRQFDAINRELYTRGVNPEYGKVSPVAAETLLHYFAPLQEQPMESKVNEAMAPEAFANAVSREPSDEDVARDWLNALNVEAACETDFTEAKVDGQSVRR